MEDKEWNRRGTIRNMIRKTVSNRIPMIGSLGIEGRLPHNLCGRKNCADQRKDKREKGGGVEV